MEHLKQFPLRLKDSSPLVLGYFVLDIPFQKLDVGYKKPRHHHADDD